MRLTLVKAWRFLKLSLISRVGFVSLNRINSSENIDIVQDTTYHLYVYTLKQMITSLLKIK
jgi:hypothetical protein